MLNKQDKWICIEWLDGSIDVEGTTAALDIQEWGSASPAYIHLVGHARSMNLGSDCAGDTLIDDGTTYLEVDDDLSGSVDIDGYGNINTFGDVLDSGDNHA